MFPESHLAANAHKLSFLPKYTVQGRETTLFVGNLYWIYPAPFKKSVIIFFMSPKWGTTHGDAQPWPTHTLINKMHKPQVEQAFIFHIYVTGKWNSFFADPSLGSWCQSTE